MYISKYVKCKLTLQIHKSHESVFFAFIYVSTIKLAEVSVLVLVLYNAGGQSCHRLQCSAVMQGVKMQVILS